MTIDALDPAYARRPIWRSAIATLGMRAIDMPSRYGFHLLVSWKLGLIDAGAFYIVFSILTLVAGVGRFGIDRALTREVARAGAVRQPQQMRRLIFHGLKLIAIIATLSGVAMACLAPWLATLLFGNARLTVPILYAAVAIIPLCVSAGIGGILAGLHQLSLSQMIYSWLWPAFFCLLAFPLQLNLDQALLLVLIATSVAGAVSMVLLWRTMPRGDGVGGESVSPHLLSLARSLFTSDIVQLMISALPALVLGMFASQAAVGAYALAWRLALILNLLVVAVGAMAAPRFADEAAREDVAGMRRTARQSLGLVLLLGIGPLIVLAIGAPYLLSMFGDGFDRGIPTLRLLLLGQFILMLTATTPELLGMTGHETALKVLNNISIIGYVLVLVLLSWALGANGAAIATVLVSLFNAAGATFLARRWLGFSPFGALLGLVRW